MSQIPNFVQEANFKVAIQDPATGQFIYRMSLPNYKGRQLQKLKEMVTGWKKFRVMKAYFYDNNRNDADGRPMQIGEYNNGRFNFI
jgi:hypothetical protein